MKKLQTLGIKIRSCGQRQGGNQDLEWKLF